MPRLFVGIKIDNQPILELLGKELRQKLILSNINWVPTTNFHLTLKFLGDVDTHLINPISSLLAHIGSKHENFCLTYNEPGYFGPITNPKVIWFDFLPNNELNLLQMSIDKSLSEIGFDIENKGYIPHLTFARVKKIKEESNFREIFINKRYYNEIIEINEFQLFQSNLKKEGPEYSIIANFKLGIKN